MVTVILAGFLGVKVHGDTVGFRVAWPVVLGVAVAGWGTRKTGQRMASGIRNP